jgi:diaminopimelate decarboxylase
MQLAASIAETFPSSNGALMIGGVPAVGLAEEFGTPLFVYDQSVMRRKWNTLRSIFSQFEIYYSVKANPNLNVLAFFLAQGAGLEIASGGEYYQAREAGAHPERLVFAGPGKSPEEIRLALSDGIGDIHAESLVEL